MRRAMLLRLTLLSLLLILAMSFLFQTALAAPPGANITYNFTEEPTPAGAGSSTTRGGTFTTLVLNATTQTPRWKAYVGNVTGSFALRDADNASIYSWGDAFTGGEVYSSRASNPDWTNLTCGDATSMSGEENYLNMTPDAVDNITSTFNESVHREFWVGTDYIQNSTCPAIATYINSQAQASDENADFQEVLLRDTSANLVWTALIDPDTLGYDNTAFDFQMIVPEDQYDGAGHTYYFWLELS